MGRVSLGRLLWVKLPADSHLMADKPIKDLQQNCGKPNLPATYSLLRFIVLYHSGLHIDGKG